jgi:hypothetical protein
MLAGGSPASCSWSSPTIINSTAATKYRKEYGGDATMFNPRTRELVARRMVREFMAQVRSGDIDPDSLGMKGVVHPKFGPKEN